MGITIPNLVSPSDRLASFLILLPPSLFMSTIDNYALPVGIVLASVTPERGIPPTIYDPPLSLKAEWSLNSPIIVLRAAS